MHRLVGAVLVAIVLLGSAAVPPSADAATDVELQRLAGTDRYATAARAALAGEWGSWRAVLVSGDSFPDALAGTAVAGYHGGPLLLTARDHLPASTRTVLEELDIQEVQLIGGTAAISPAVDDELRRLGFRVNRVAVGNDRYETAEMAAQYMSDSGCHCPPWETVIVSGQVWADAVSAAPLLYGSGGSIRSLLLTERDRLPEVTRRHLEAGIQDVVIVGGTSAVSERIEREIRAICNGSSGLLAATDDGCIDVVRVAGADRYETAVAVAQSINRPPERVSIANGSSFADALVSGRYAHGVEGAALLGLSRDDLGATTMRFLRGGQEVIAEVTVVGDETMISEAAAEAARRAATSSS